MWYWRLAPDCCALSRRAATFWISAIPLSRDLVQELREIIKINGFSHEIVATATTDCDSIQVRICFGFNDRVTVTGLRLQALAIKKSDYSATVPN